MSWTAVCSQFIAQQNSPGSSPSMLSSTSVNMRKAQKAMAKSFSSPASRPHRCCHQPSSSSPRPLGGHYASRPSMCPRWENFCSACRRPRCLRSAGTSAAAPMKETCPLLCQTFPPTFTLQHAMRSCLMCIPLKLSDAQALLLTHLYFSLLPGIAAMGKADQMCVHAHIQRVLSAAGLPGDCNSVLHRSRGDVLAALTVP